MLRPTTKSESQILSRYLLTRSRVILAFRRPFWKVALRAFAKSVTLDSVANEIVLSIQRKLSFAGVIDLKQSVLNCLVILERAHTLTVMSCSLSSRPTYAALDEE